MSYDDWLEQPRVGADNARAREEAIDEWLGNEFDYSCRTVQGAEQVMSLLCDDPTDWPALIAFAHSGRCARTVEDMAGRMIEAARAAWVSDTNNRARAAQCIAEAKVRGGDDD